MNDAAMQLSVLDRLMDDEPTNSRETPLSVRQRTQRLRQSVRRDLEALLNSRVSWHTWPSSFKALDQSLLRYGLPDFSSMNMSSQEHRAQLCRLIEQTIRDHEPRFVEVRVSMPNSDQPLDRVLRLRIDALLHADPLPEAMTFDSEFEPVSLGMRVKDVRA